MIADANEDIAPHARPGPDGAAASAGTRARGSRRPRPLRSPRPAPPVATAPTPRRGRASPPAPPPPAGRGTARGRRPRPVAASSGRGDGRVKASPLARAMAARENVPLAELAGSGPGGRIVKRDIESYVAAPHPAQRGRDLGRRRSVVPFPAVAAGTELPLSNMRKTIAQRLSESAFTAPHFYVTVEIDMGAAVALREQLLKGENVKVSFNDLVVKACARALTRFPMVNASWGGDKIVTHGEVHVGIAVAIPDGLITPVVRNADQKSVLAIATEVKDLAGRAREKKLRPEEFMGSTFTISNLGMFDVEAFTAIINPPDSAILAVGSVRKVPVVAGDALADRAPHEGDAELGPPGGGRSARRPVPRGGPAPAGEPGQPARLKGNRPRAQQHAADSRLLFVTSRSAGERPPAREGRRRAGGPSPARERCPRSLRSSRPRCRRPRIPGRRQSSARAN